MTRSIDEKKKKMQQNTSARSVQNCMANEKYKNKLLSEINGENIDIIK